MLTTSASSLVARGPVTECHGVQLRAHLRSVAVLVEVTGRLGDANRTLVTHHVHRFALVGDALVLDLREASGVDEAFTTGLSPLADLTVVLNPAQRDALVVDSVAIVGSVGDAMRRITKRLTARRAHTEIGLR